MNKHPYNPPHARHGWRTPSRLVSQASPGNPKGTRQITINFDPDKLGWRPFFQEQITPDEVAGGWQPARVCQGKARRCHVWSARGRGTHTLEINLFGEEGLPAVGDWLLLDPKQKKPPRRLERFSALTRQAPGSKFATQVLAANVDTLLIVTACNQEFNVGRIERYLALAAEAQTRPVLVLTKADLAPGADPAPFIDQARTLGEHLQIECIDARDADQLEAIRKLCGPGQTVAALGSSGVGKSTLVNGLTGLSGEAGQQVGEVRGDDNKGKHTTSSRSLHPLPAGGVLVDLPGIRELQLTEAGDGIDDTFAEITALVADCRFNNCSHTNEPGCAITAALTEGTLDPRRLANYRKLRGEQKIYTATKADRARRDDQRTISKKAQRRLDDEQRE